jgi:serine/threonine protein kinase
VLLPPSRSLCRTPRFGSRRDLLRLEALGEGNFGEVFKASCAKKSLHGHGNITITVAVKTLKISDTAARGELLREAALMTLFEHPNLVAAIGQSRGRPLVVLPTRTCLAHLADYCSHHVATGVVTVPRDMPAMLVLEYCEHGTLIAHVKDSTDLSTARLLTYCHDTASGLHYLSSRRIVHRDVRFPASRQVSCGCATRRHPLIPRFVLPPIMTPDRGS